MTQEQFKRAMEIFAHSFRENEDDFIDLCEYIDPDGGLTEEEAYQIFLNEISNPEVLQYLEKKNHIDHVGHYDSEGNEDYEGTMYYPLGYAANTEIDDKSGLFRYSTICGITSHGEVIVEKRIECYANHTPISINLTYDVEICGPNSERIFDFNIITAYEDSPLRKYMDYFFV